MYKSLRGLNFSKMFAVFLILFSLILIATAVSAWTPPPANPPGGNVAAPINVGTENQIKNGGIGVNSLAVFGNAVLSGTNRYLNFGDGALESGYGIRDNNGVIECKNKNGSWGTCGGGTSDGGGNASFLICSNSSTDPRCVAATTNFGVGDANHRAINCRHQNPQTPGNVGLQLTYKSGIWYYYNVDSALVPCVDNTILVATWGVGGSGAGNFGGLYTENWDGTCRYRNPYTMSCSCPSGYARAEFNEFYAGQCQFYQDQGQHNGNCGIKSYQCYRAGAI